MPSEIYNKEEFSKIAAQRSIEDAERRPAQLEELTKRTMEARRALFAALEGIGHVVDTFEPASDKYVKTLRDFNSSAVLELKNGMRAFEDVRKFFLADEHVEEVRRLKEFVELCERLKALKDSGFLDAMADTILKLS